MFQLHSLRIGEDCFRNNNLLTLNDLRQLRYIEFGERSFGKCQKAVLTDLPSVEECMFAKRVLAKVEDIQADSSNNYHY